MAKKVNREETRTKVRLEQQKFVDDNLKYLDISSLTKIVGISRSSYYKHKEKSLSNRGELNKLLKKYILKCHEKFKGIYGKFRIQAWVMKTYGIKVNHKRIYRLMKELKIQSVIRKKRYKRKYKSPEIVKDNLLKRNFNADNLNEKWSIDISYIPLNKTKFNYLCAIKDLYNNEVIAYKIGKTQSIKFVKETIKLAIKGRDVSNLIIHSDQGFQFTHKSYINLLEKNKIQISHSRRGNCLDNSPIECFFGHLKSEFKYLYCPKNDTETITSIKKYIKFYNSQRIQIKLNSSSPIEFRTAA